MNHVRRSKVRTAVGLLVLFLGVIGWFSFLSRSFGHIVDLARQPDPPVYWLNDWHVYYAGARDFLERDLYLTPLTLHGWPLPTPVFNQMPGAALIAIPLLPLGREFGGLVWLVLGVVSLAVAAVTAVYLAGIGRVAAWSGALLAIYTGVYFFVGHVTLGNVNHILLAMVAAFAVAHLRGRQRIAGILLGAAIVIKAWPVMLVPLLLRERRVQELAWAIATVVACGFVTFVWLGWSVVPDAVAALTTQIPVPSGSRVLWTTWAREVAGLPSWLPPFGAILLAIVPAKGRLGIGLGVIAGLTLVSNLWDHYLATFVFALLLIVADVAQLVNVRRLPTFSNRIPPQTASSP